MAIPRTIVAIVAIAIGSALGLAGVAVILWMSGGPCSATQLVFSKPLNALIGMAPPHPLPPDVIWYEGSCGPSPLRTWGLLWGPICILVGLAGAFASRNSGYSWAGGVAGAIVGGVPLVNALNQFLSGVLLFSSVAVRCSIVVLLVLAISAGFGLIGGKLGRRHA